MVADTANRLGLQVVLIGRFPPATMEAFLYREHIPWMDFLSYRGFLARQHSAAAIAPLPTKSVEHQGFIDAKSDIKVVDFLSHAIPSVYSAAFPYSSSDLDPKPLVADDMARWRSAIEEVARNPGRYAPQEAVDKVRRERAYQAVAPILGVVLLREAGRDFAVPRPSLNASLRRLEKYLRSWRARRR